MVAKTVFRCYCQDVCPPWGGFGPEKIRLHGGCDLRTSDRLSGGVVLREPRSTCEGHYRRERRRCADTALCRGNRDGALAAEIIRLKAAREGDRVESVGPVSRKLLDALEMRPGDFKRT